MNYKDSNSEILKSVFNRLFFSKFKDINNISNKSFELIITPECNHACPYCYIYKHKDELYPVEIRDEKTILNNLEIFMDWYIEQKFHASLDIFSGEVLAQEIGLKSLEIIYDKIKTVPKNECSIRHIIIPTNMSFLSNDLLEERVKNIIDKFKSIDIPIHLSASIDGAYLEDNRKVKEKEFIRNKKFYDKLFSFTKENDINFHPMVSSLNIDKWIDNYNWFMNKINDGNYNVNMKRLMMLEVRDDNWTTDSIRQYLNFLNHIIDFEYKVYTDENKEDEFIERVLNNKHIISYDNIALTLRDDSPNDRLSCAIQDRLCIRLGDLAFAPCHRTMYSQYIYGKFVLENNKIKDIEGQNVALATTIYSLKSNNQPGCESCKIKHYCAKGCLGSQFEYSNNLFSPNETVCNLYKAKISFLILKYYKMGLIDKMLEMDSVSDIIKQNIIDIYNKLGELN